MKTMIEKIFSARILALMVAVCATSGAWADLVAEWGPGEFPVSAQGAAAVTSTDGTCTLTKNNAGNISTANDLTIKGWPAVITPSSSMSALTVVVGYKAPSATASGTIVQFGSGTSDGDTKISANLVNGSLRLGWQKNYSWGDSNSAITGLNQPNDDAVHFVTLASSESNGTTIRFDGGNKVTAGGLKWGSMSIAEITLGAIRGPENILTDVEYQYIAVYNEVLSDAAALTAYQRAKKAVVCSGTVTPSVDGENNCTFTVTEDAAYNVESAATYNTVTFNVTEGKTLILSGATLTGSNGVTVNGGMVEVSSATALAGTLKGDGTLCYTTVAPSGLGCKTSDWEGTLWIRDYGTSSTGWQLDEFGSSKSTLRLTGIQGHLNYANGTVSPTVELYGTGLTVNNGSGGYKTTLNELTGSGILTVSGGSSNGNGLLIKKASGFTGSINVSNANRYTVTIGGTTCTSGSNGKLIIASGTEVTVASGKQFKGAGGIEVNGTMNLVSGCSISGTITGSGTLVCDGYVPTITLTDSNWTGTLWLKNTAIAGLDSSSYGNSGSTLKFTGVTGYFAQNHEMTFPIEVEDNGTTVGFHYNNGYAGSVTAFSDLKGTGTFKTSGSGNGETIFVKNYSAFAGSLDLASKKVVFGGSKPSGEDANHDGKLIINVDGEQTATVASGKTWGSYSSITVNGEVTVNGFMWASGGITVDGELKAASLDNFGGGTSITTTDNGVFTLVSNSNTDDMNVNYTRIQGTGTLKFEGTNYRTISTNNFPTAMIVENNISDGLIHRLPGVEVAIGSLSGTGQMRSDWGGSGSTGDRDLRILQAKDTTYSGLFASSNDRIDEVYVAPGESTAGTLTLSGTQTASNGLIVETGASVNLTGTWVGNVTVAGSFACPGTLTGNLTAQSGSTLDFSDATLEARISGSLSLSNGTTIKLPAEASLPYQVATAGDGIFGNVTIQIGEGSPATGKIALRGGTITAVTSFDIDTEKTYTVSDVFGTPSATGSYEINVTADATLNLEADTAVAIVKFNVEEGKTLTITGNTLTGSNGVYINGEGKVVCSAANSLSGAIRGDGRIVFEGTLPPSGLQASLQDGASWTGTVELKDYEEKTDGHKIIVLSRYGNSNSTVALNGVISTMYAVSGDYPAVTLKEIEIGEGGWSDTANEYKATMLYTAKLTGHGPITVMTRGSGTVKFIGDHTFDGSVTMDSGTAKQLAFMRTSSDTIPGVAAKAIVVAGGLDMSIASGNKWTAPGGIKIDGTLTVLTAEKAGATPDTTISAYQDDETIDETVDATKGTTTYASIPLVATLDNSSVEISDNQASMGSVTVVGASSITGSGGALMKELTISNDATLTYDPVITPLRIKSAPVFTGTGKLKLAPRYAGVTCGKFHLVTYPSESFNEYSADALKALVDSSSFDNATYTVTEETVGSYKQLVLKVGDYDTSAKDVSIAQFGDSITEGIWRDGYRGTPNYRIPLMQLLEAYGYRPEARGYRSVGSTDANGVPADDNYKWHTGISAQRIYTGMTGDSLRAGFMESIEAHLEQVGVTDIITLKIGTNDSIGGETADNMFEGWSNLVWKIVRMRPTSKIVVCAPVKIRSGEKNAPGLRTKIADYMALTYEQGGFPNGQVTMTNGIDIVTDNANYYLTDNVHPNWNGHMQLANAWLPAVTNAFESMKVNDVIVHAEDTYTPQPSVASAETVAELASYRAGYVKLATFTNFGTKLNTWGETPYSYVNNDYKDTSMGRVAYFVARKTTASPDTRYVWVDMDADTTTGTTLANFGVPTSASVNGVVNNLHIYSNSSAIENVAPTVSGVKGTLMRTEKGISKDDGISTTLAPAGPYGYDWNDTIGSGSWGVMNMARIFDGATPTDHRKLLAAQMLFDFNGFNGGRQNALGLGDFAVHGPYNTANGSVDHFNLNWTFTTAKDDMPTMDVRALETGVIEIWGKQVYTATMEEGSDFSKLTFSPELPDVLTYCDLVVNVDANSTLTFDEAVSVGSIRFNIADGVTLTLGGTLNLPGAVVISGPGKLHLSSNGTFGRMDVASSATLGFADGVSLALTDSLWVASGSTLTIETAVPSVSGNYTLISARSVYNAEAITIDVPSTESLDMQTSIVDGDVILTAIPVKMFTYTAIHSDPAQAPSGWFNSWSWDGFNTYMRIGPNADANMVYEVSASEHPGSALEKTSSFTVSLYADVSKMASDGTTRAVMFAYGGGRDNGNKFLVMYREGDYIKLANWNNDGFTGDWAASVPVATGYHLWTASFNASTGTITLYRDDGTDSGCKSSGTPANSLALASSGRNGLQIGTVWGNCPNTGNFAVGTRMALVGVYGYDVALSDTDVQNIAASYPATDTTVIPSKIDMSSYRQLTVYSSTYNPTLGGDNYFGVTHGTVTIPADNIVNVTYLKCLNTSWGENNATLNVDGTLNITTTSSAETTPYYDGGKGILLGHWGGTGTYNITGSLIGRNACLETVFSAGSQTININGGLLAVRDIFQPTTKSNSTINLSNDGTFELAKFRTDGNPITENFGYGTFKVADLAADTLSAPWAINFTGTSSQPTTLDPNGHTLVMSAAALTGTGYIKVASSVEEGEKGSVTFAGSAAGFTGTVVIDDASKNLITFTDIAAYHGNILYAVTGSSELPSYLDGFTGVLTITGGTVDATAVDLSGATVQVNNADATLVATAGKEGNVAVIAGACQLMVDNQTFLFDGHVFAGGINTAAGATLTFIHSEGYASGGLSYAANDVFTSAELADVLADNNLVPYFRIFTGVADGDDMAGTLSTKAHWGKLPESEDLPVSGNVAIRVADGKTLTIDVDNTPTFGEVQVFGSGKVIFQGAGTMTVTKGIVWIRDIGNTLIRDIGNIDKGHR